VGTTAANDSHRHAHRHFPLFLAVKHRRLAALDRVKHVVSAEPRLKKEPWGQSSFIVSDPDGNALCFAG
jgi:hypothetical protein